MKKENVCQHCSKPLGAEAIKGLCPECLMKMGLGIGTEATGKARPFVPPTPAELASHFPQLEILAFVGQGGMGAVYKARQKQLDRTVALKILPPGIGQDPAFAERFAREAKAMARLNHPGIVTIHDFGQVQGCASAEPAPGADAAANSAPETGTSQDPLYYFVMEFVDGVSLRQLMRAGRVSPREALAIVPQICDALQYAHDQGIVHRDIKPENILLDRQGRVKVADFGLAKLMGTDAFSTLSSASIRGDADIACPAGAVHLTDKDRVMGTPHYMAPEQVDHPAAVDHRADIYSLGVVFYQMLTGELPGRQLEPPSKKVQIDVRLDEIVLRALEKEPKRRFGQVSEVKTAVETIVQDSAEHAGPSRLASGRKAALPVNWNLLAGVSVGVIMMLLVGCWHFKASRAQQTVNLLQRYPTTLTAGDFSEAHARAWQFTEADLYHLQRFSLQVSNDLLVETEPANVGIGHCADGAVWALLIPQQHGTVTSRVAGRAEPIAQVWLRFHPKEINRVFPPETVSRSGATNLAAQMRFIANLKLNPKLGSSFISFPQGYDGPVKLTIPRPQDMTVDVDLRDGVRRFFMVDTEKQTARQDTQQWYQYVHPESRTTTSEESAEEYVAQQLKEANAGNYWAKYRLWEAYSKGQHGVAKDSAKADRWLKELIQGVWLVTFAPTNGFNPVTPMEFLNKIQQYSPVVSEPECIGIAGFFRTKNQDGKLIGSFLSNSPERLKAAFEKNPYLKVLSIDPLTPELFTAYEQSVQESLPSAESKTGSDPGPSDSGILPKHFSFDYKGPQAPGKRVWKAVNDKIWIEQYESGESSRFKVVKRATVEGTQGTVVAKISGNPEETKTENDGTFQVFIPDVGSQQMQIWFRFHLDGEWQQWQRLAQMEEVE